jgi:periplasmic divalent cation tolerance protein
VAAATMALVLVTAPSLVVAEQLTEALVEERLAACGNIVPGITSIYRWQGAVQKDSEVLIVFKTETGTAPKLMARVEQLHPYEVPEAIMVPIAAGLPSYLAWVVANTAG